MKDEKIEHLRISSYDGTRFEIISTPGNRKYGTGFKKADRLFYIRLSNGHSLEFPYNYGDILRMLELVLDNIIFDHTFDAEYNGLMDLMKIIKLRRKPTTTLKKWS